MKLSESESALVLSREEAQLKATAENLGSGEEHRDRDLSATLLKLEEVKRKIAVAKES